MAATTMRKTKPTVGSLIDRLHDLREKKRLLNDELKLLDSEYSETEKELMALMDSEGVTKSTGKKASAGISESIHPDVIDWDAFLAYIHKNKFYHLLQRRPSSTACRELFETKGKIPGVEPFVKRTINLRNL
jgi:chromosome segregation ATPase